MAQLVNGAFGINLTIADFFKNITIEDLARLIDSTKTIQTKDGGDQEQTQVFTF